jgi:hypothetical protein
MHGTYEMEGGEGGSQLPQLHPEAVLKRADSAETLGTDVATPITLEAFGELPSPELAALFNRHGLVGLQAIILYAFYSFSRHNLWGIGCGAAT